MDPISFRRGQLGRAFRLRALRPELVALSLILSLLPVRASEAQLATLVEDLGRTPGGTGSSSPRDFVRLGERIVFLASESSTGIEPWGTGPGGEDTLLLADTCAGDCGGPLLLGATNTVAFYASSLDDTNLRAMRLWRTDGTRSGTFPLLPPSEHSDLSFLVGNGRTTHAVLGNRLYLTGCTADLGCELWATAPDASSLELVADLRPGAAGSLPFALASTSSDLFFEVSLAEGLRFAVLHHGDPAPVVLAVTAQPTALATSGDLAFLLTEAGGGKLWVSDGTAAGTRAIADFDGHEPFPRLPWLAPIGGGILFLADDGTHGTELWASDGTPAGTMRVTGFAPEQPFGSLRPEQVAKVEHGFLFWADDGAGHRGLWSSDGNPASAGWLEQVPGTQSIDLVTAGGVALFAAPGPSGSDQLWRSDGTPAGTYALGDFCQAPCVVTVSSPVVVDDAAFFVVDDLSGDDQLWTTDGSEPGTFPLATSSSIQRQPLQIARLDDELFFSAGTDQTGEELHVLSGLLRAADTTHRILDLELGAPSADPDDLVAIGADAYFSIVENGRRELRRLPPGGPPAKVPAAPALLRFCGSPPDCEVMAPAGQRLVFVSEQPSAVWGATGSTAALVHSPGEEEGLIQDLVSIGSVAAYMVESGNDLALYATDGTAAGTLQVLELPASHLFARNLAGDGESLYFVTSGVSFPESSVRKLWISDGTPAGTDVLATFPDGGVNEPLSFVRVGSSTFFVASTPETGSALWVTDGTAGGTHLVRDLVQGPDSPGFSQLVAHQGLLYFFVQTLEGGVELWRSNGSSGGTQRVRALVSPEVSSGLGPTELTSVGGLLLFVFDDGASGRELWVSDGTDGGTKRLIDLAPGPASSSPHDLFGLGDRAYFQAHDGEHGFELWSTDGTAAGTLLVTDIAPGPASSRPRPLGAVLHEGASRLYLSADDGLVGRELWVLDTEETGCVPSERALCLAGGRFRAEMAWRDFEYQSGLAQAVPLTADTGYFWFFDPDNVESILKVLDARGVNQHFWVFYGALSNVEYALTVTDAQNGTAQRYRNPLGVFASDGDVEAFGPNGAHLAAHVPLTSAAAVSATCTGPRAAVGPCVAGAETLCLNDGRFALRVAWRDFAGNTGTGVAVPLTGDTGSFWFFDQSNVELVIKVLDARALNDHFWVFYGALSNVGYEITITDTQTGAVKLYTNPLGRFASAGDTQAF